MNRPFSNFLAQDSKKIFEQHSHTLFDTHQQKSCDLRLLSGNRKVRWIQLESVVVQNGGDDPERFRAVIKEVTARVQREEALRKKRDALAHRVATRTAELEEANEKLRRQVYECELAEEALRESEHNYSTLVEDALVGVYIIKDGIIEFANDKFAAIYGYEKDELIGMRSAELVHPEDRPMIEEMRQKRLQGEKVPSEYEIRGLKLFTD
ncbi:MAG: PAS domain S-box protein [Desulfobacterales bacterium]